MAKKINITKEELYQLYCVENNSSEKIGEIYNCTGDTILNHLRRHNIDIKPRNQLEDLSGKKFNSLTVVRRYKNSKHKNTRWLCLCDCGNETIASSSDLKTDHHNSCGKCGKHYFLSDSYWAELKRQAKRRGYEFDLDKDYMYKLWLKQNKKCALSDLILTIPKGNREQCGPKNTASIDRIDNNLGYIKGNVQWVHKKLNKMRGSLTVEEFVYYCKIVGDYKNDNK